MNRVAHSLAFALSPQHSAGVEQRLLRALQAGGIAAWEWNLVTDHVVWSGNAEELLGLHSGHTSEFEERVHPQDQGRHRAALKATVETGEPYDVEIRFEKPDGTVIWVHDKAELQTSPEGQRVLIGITADITARKRAEAEALDAAALLRTTLESIDQGLIMFDSSDTIQISNTRAAELLGVPAEFLAERPSLRDLIQLQQSKNEFVKSDEAFHEWGAESGQRGYPDIYEREHPDGTVLEVRTVSLSGGGAVRTLTDITARRTAEAALQASEERARDFANIASDWYWETDAEFRYTSVTGMAKVLLTEDAIGKTIWDVVGAGQDAPEWRRLVRAVAARKPFRDFEVELKTPRSRSVWLSTSGHPIHDGTGRFTGYRGVSTNITHRKMAEAERERLHEQLNKSQRLQSVEQLTGRIADDFNNLLTVILGNSEMLVEDATDAALTETLSRQIMDAAGRGADLTQKLLAFGRRHLLKPERLSLKREIEHMTPMLRRTLGEHIALETDLHESQLVALTDRTLLESAILNLATNARDAMPEGGTLTIQTGGRVAGPNEGTLPMGQPVVYLTISDTGTGIPPDVLSRVFEPFFTLKEFGKGSGLGLSMVYGFTQQTGGHVSIESHEGAGTSVTLVLPAVANALEQAHGNDEASELATPTERILLVENDPAVLSFVSSRLLSLGYKVRAVSTGHDALELLAHDESFDLLLSDLVLPKGMSGVGLVQRARSLKPTLKVLLTSVYSEEVFAQHVRPAEGTLLLRKPYKRRELAETLRKVLG